jgi:hypothetical protein
MAWFIVQLGRFVGEAPDFDAMVSLREAVVFHRDGLGGAIAASVGTGVHPPLLDALSWLCFSVFGESPQSQQLLGIACFVVLAAAVERLLAPWLGTAQRILAALAVAACPSIAIAMFLVSREGLMLAPLVAALALVLAPGDVTGRRLGVLAAVLALLPLTKETGVVLVFPFAVYVTLVGPGEWRERLRRGALVMGVAVAVAIVWRIVLRLEGGEAWHTWVESEDAERGPYVVALRAMFGFESGIYLRQNLANAFIVNWLWVPALLAVATRFMVFRRPSPVALRRAIVLLVGLAAIYAWTTLTFPTFTVPRYAAPLTLFALLVIFLGLVAWPRRLRGWVIGALLAAFALGAWAPTDPVSKALWHTMNLGGERFYDTPWAHRGPDRSVYNLAILRATERMNARLRRVFATDVTLVTGDCDSMKFGEKLFSVGFTPSVYDQGIPGARPLRCVHLNELPPGAADGTDKIGLVRSPEEDAAGAPLAISGPAVVVIH